jgi:hypothetical protein
MRTSPPPRGWPAQSPSAPRHGSRSRCDTGCPGRCPAPRAGWDQSCPTAQTPACRKTPQPGHTPPAQPQCGLKKGEVSARGGAQGDARGVVASGRLRARTSASGAGLLVGGVLGVALGVAHAGARDARRALVGQLHALRCEVLRDRAASRNPRSARTQKQPPAMVASFRLGAEGVTPGEGAGRSVRSAASGLRAEPPDPMARSRRNWTACVVTPVPRAAGGGAERCVAACSALGARRREESAREVVLLGSLQARIPRPLH